MGLVGFIFALVGVPLIAGAIIISVSSGFQRETTGIFERWGSRNQEQRQALLDQAAAIDTNPNISGRGNSPLVGSANEDGDCLVNAEELSQGLDPQNPDTDGDGIDDCVEISRGTNPADPTSGGLQPVIPTSSPSAEPPVLYIDQVIKTVNDKHLIYTAPDSILRFHIQVKAYMTGVGTKYIRIEDALSGQLQFVDGQIGNAGETFTEWPNGRWEFPVTAGSHTIDIYFNAKVLATSPTLISNTARATDRDNPLVGLSDTVFINVEVGERTSPEPPAVIDLTKDGRTSSANPWYRYIFAMPNDIVEFRIIAEVSENDILLKDILPNELVYQPASLKLYHNNQPLGIAEVTLRSVFENGLLLNRGAGIYQLNFSAKVNSEAPFALTNTASLYQGQTELETVESIVTTKP